MENDVYLFIYLFILFLGFDFPTTIEYLIIFYRMIFDHIIYDFR